MAEVATAILSAHYCLRSIDDIDATNAIRSAYDNLITALPATTRVDLNNPKSSRAEAAAKRLYDIDQHLDPDAILHARKLTENIKRLRDGHYFIAQAAILIASNNKTLVPPWSSRRRGSTHKQTIILCEDMPNFRDDFVMNHKDEFNVIALDKIQHLQPLMNFCKKHRCSPDLVVLDLYWPREHDDQRKKDAREKIDVAVEHFRKEIAALKNAVFESLEPSAIEELLRIREHHWASNLPILIYTRAGNFTLDARDVEIIYNKNADFMPKYRPAYVEKQRMRYFIDMRLPWWKTLPTDMNWRVTFLALGFLLAIFVNYIMHIFVK